MNAFEFRIAVELARVRHSAYINTDLACRFVLDEIHGMAVRYIGNV